MSTDLKYLALTAMLTASLWIPYVIAQVKTNGPLQPKNYVDPTMRPLPDWGKRAPFAALVILIQLAGKANGTTAFLAASFFWLRVAHAIVYWAGIPYVRTIVFTLGYVAVIGLFVELMI